MKDKSLKIIIVAISIVLCILGVLFGFKDIILASAKINMYSNNTVKNTDYIELLRNKYNIGIVYNDENSIVNKDNKINTDIEEIEIHKYDSDTYIKYEVDFSRSDDIKTIKTYKNEELICNYYECVDNIIIDIFDLSNRYTFKSNIEYKNNIDNSINFSRFKLDKTYINKDGIYFTRKEIEKYSISLMVPVEAIIQEDNGIVFIILDSILLRISDPENIDNELIWNSKVTDNYSVSYLKKLDRDYIEYMIGSIWMDGDQNG